MRIQVPGKGPPDASIAFVGEQPGRYEVISRKPFIGPAGKEFDKCLADAEIPRLECYITNTLKALDYPKEHYVTPPRTKKPPRFTAAADEHLDYLKEELSRLGSNVICALGNVALFALTNRWGIMKWRGSVIDSTLLPGRKIVPAIHPSSILQGAFLNRYLIIKDLITAREESAYPDIRKIPRKISIEPSYLEVLEHLGHLINYGLGGGIIDFDIEVLALKNTTLSEMVCIAFATSPTSAFCIPLQGPGGDYFTPDQEAQIMLKVAELLEHPDIPKRGQGITFDCAFMLSKYGIRVRGDLHDTMVAQKILLPDFRVGLDFITREYTDINYYKEEGKKWFAIGGPWQQFWTYNGMDTIATAASHPTQIQFLHRQGNLATYERQRRLIAPLTYMMTRGTLVDIDGMLHHRYKVADEQKKLRVELNELVGRELPETFASSSKQVAAYFYGEKGLKPYMKKGSVTTDTTALTRLKRRGYREAEIIQRLRFIKSKALGIYLDTAKVSPDGRYRCYWNPVGAETGRISSSEDIYGQGTNLMNWPHELLTYLIADPGYCYYSIDLGQAENRVVAFVGGVAGLIECFEKNIDVHALVGSKIADTLTTGGKFTWQEIKQQDKQRVKCILGTGDKTWRDYGKRTGHARNYAMGVGTFSLQIETPEAEATQCLNSYDKLFPEVRGNYQPLVRQMLMEGRTVTNLFNRKRIFMGKWDDNLFRDAYAQIPQSTVADKINEHGMFPIYYEEGFEPIELLNQIHDSIGFQVPVSAGFTEHARMIIRLKQRLEQPLQWHDREFTIPADLTQGLTWNKDDGVEYKGKEFSENPIILGEKLEANYHKMMEEKG